MTAAVVGCSAPTPPAPTSSPAPTSVVDACPASGTTLSVGEVEGASGLRAAGIFLTNCDTRPHTVEGFPAVRVLDESGAPMDVLTGNGSEPVSSPDAFDAPARPITLAPGERATARVLWRSQVTSATAPVLRGRYLEVAPAPGAPSARLEPRGGIDLGTTGRIAVNAWRR
ncbi:DUF4232 domain-containing protein [Actinokineospora guangxiensis]|uniref:DUF4232 domain-containing protein n=1 Tax=Actinokineospora guangxiensis TaxID=1490288 RepID=A0ABW0EJY1_9PSEU